MSAYCGAKVHLTTTDGLYEGIIHAVDQVHKKISLKKVVVLPEGKKLVGLHNFFSQDIVDLAVVDISYKNIGTVQDPSPSADSNVVDADADVNSRLSPDVETYTKAEDKSHKTNRIKNSHNVGYHANDVSIISKLGANFYAAVSHLQNQPVLGMAMEGIDLGRHGLLSFVQFSTKDRLYIFDIRKLGGTIFNKGIGDIIENANIIKVIHDCRPLSDLLYHHYSLKLANVFDTQVADVTVWKQDHNGQLPSLVKTLAGCLLEYLDPIELECANFLLVQQKLIEDDPHLWKEHPPASNLLKYVDRRVRKLLDLRTALMKRLMADFDNGVTAYLSIMRDKPSSRVKKHASKDARVPRSFHRLEQYSPERQEPAAEVVSGSYFDRDHIVQPSYWSRDVWREGSQFQEYDDDEKYAWLREMQAKQVLSNGVAAGLEQEENDQIGADDAFTDFIQQNDHMSKKNICPTDTSSNSYFAGCKSKTSQDVICTNQKKQVKWSKQTDREREQCSKQTDRETEQCSKQIDRETEQCSIQTDRETEQCSKQTDREQELCYRWADKEHSATGVPQRNPSINTMLASSEESNRHLPSSSSDEISNTSDTEGSPNKSFSKFNHSAPKEYHTLTLRDISRTLAVKSPIPLLTMNFESNFPTLECKTKSRLKSPTPLISYASVVSGESPVESSQEPPGKTGRGRGTAIKMYREIIDNCRKPKESPVPVLRGSAVRCDFPSDVAVKNAPRGIAVSKNTPIMGLSK